MKSILYFQYQNNSQNPYHHYYQTILQFLKTNFKVSEISLKDDGLIEALYLGQDDLFNHEYYLDPLKGSFILENGLKLRYTGQRVILDLKN